MKKISKLFLFGLIVLCANAVNATALTTAISQTDIGLVQKAGDVRTATKFQQDCAAGLSLDSCAKTPTPTGCPVGSHWVTIGSGIAHCVANDPACSGIVTHDTLGNPTGCTPVVTGTSTQYNNVACGSGYSGSTTYSRTVTSWSDGTTTYGSWAYYDDSCVANAPPPPPPPPPVCTNGATNYPSCTLDTPTSTCTPADVVTSSDACPSGQMGGPILTHSTISCPGSVSGSYTSGSCSPGVCANGANNFPTCTLQQPTPLVCPYNGQGKESCTASGAPGSSGKHLFTTYYDDGTGTGTCTHTVEVLGNCGYNPSYWYRDL